MGLFNKKEELPQLPPVPSLPELPNSGLNPKINELPTMPSNGSGEILNQEIVKSAVTDSSGDKKGVEGLKNFHPNENSFVPSIDSKNQFHQSSIPKPPAVSEVSEQRPQAFHIPQKSISDIRSPASSSQAPPAFNMPPAGMLHSQGFLQNKSEPIFVRIDKFQAAKKEFEEVRVKIREIEHMLRRIKEVKIREDSEIQEWVRDVEGLKVRLSDIDSHIFNKL